MNLCKTLVCLKTLRLELQLRYDTVFFAGKPGTGNLATILILFDVSIKSISSKTLTLNCLSMPLLNLKKAITPADMIVAPLVYGEGHS